MAYSVIQLLQHAQKKEVQRFTNCVNTLKQSIANYEEQIRQRDDLVCVFLEVLQTDYQREGTAGALANIKSITSNHNQLKKEGNRITHK